jgi:hypothetical protein
MPAASERCQYGFRANAWQLTVTGVLTVLIGCTLQLHSVRQHARTHRITPAPTPRSDGLTRVCRSLSCWQMVVLDAAGRQFARSTYASKLAFLAPFALTKVSDGPKVLYRYTRTGGWELSHAARWERC